MNIRINKKLVAYLLAGSMGFSLCACQAENMVDIQSLSFDEVIEEVKDDSSVDNALKRDNITMVNPFVCSIEENMNMLDAAEYLERELEITSKLLAMDMKPLDDNDPNYQKVMEASLWTIDDAYKILYDLYYGDDEARKSANFDLECYLVCVDRRLRMEGIEIVSKLLNDSLRNASITDNYDYYKELRSNFAEIRDNRELLDDVELLDLYYLINTAFNGVKEIIYNDENVTDKKLVFTNQ